MKKHGNLLIKDLPPALKALALLRQKEAGNVRNENVSLHYSNESFSWGSTLEGMEWWNDVWNGNYEEKEKELNPEPIYNNYSE